MAAAPAGPPDPARNPWLDLLRAVAVALVLARHGARAAQADFGADPGIAGVVMLNGWVGVDLFFVLSGYLITRQLQHELRAPGGLDFVRYLLRRALRIVPAYFAVLILILLGGFPLYAVSTESVGLRTLYHAAFLQDYLPSDFNVVFWSLGVEEKFYLIAPFLVLFLLRAASRPRLLVVFCGLLLVSPVLRAATFVYLAPLDYDTFFRTLRSPFHASLEPLLAGVALAMLERTGQLGRRPAIGRLAFWIGAIALFGLLASHEFLAAIGAFDAVLQPTLIAALCATMTAGAVLLAGSPAPFARTAGLVARLSYALYLVHLPLLPLASALARTTLSPVPGFWLIYLSLSALVALALHIGVERPFLLYRERLRSSWQPRLTAP